MQGIKFCVAQYNVWKCFKYLTCKYKAFSSLLILNASLFLFRWGWQKTNDTQSWKFLILEFNSISMTWMKLLELWDLTIKFKKNGQGT